ncbi:hypothetical protein EV426DRAFT_551212 [Tirmania nivea]|nr:hypothetical protein EV426DRAFT_551212 [Tirmania nivea]
MLGEHDKSYHLAAVQSLSLHGLTAPAVARFVSSRNLASRALPLDDFTICDIPPSYPQEPTPQAVNERVGYFVSDAEWERIKTNNEGAGQFDYVVIGSGFCAMAFIREIIDRQTNAKILCLERGGNVLPEHLQNLGSAFTSLGGDNAETFHWSLSRETHNEGYRCRGLFPFFGGRSTIWSACCPQPSDGTDGKPDELRDFPKSMRDIQNDKKFWERARNLIRVISAADIKNGIYGELQKELDTRLSKVNGDSSIIPGAYKSEPTQMSVRPRPSTTRKFHIYSIPSDLLALKLANPDQIKIRLDCPVEGLVHRVSDSGSKVVERICVKGDHIGLPLINPKTKVIVATSPIPVATLLLNSFPHMERTVGKRLLGHFLTVLVARIPKSRFLEGIASFQFGANYVAGEDPETRLKYHIQVSTVHSPHPEKDADDVLRESPDYTTAPNFEHLESSEDYILFSFASHAEMTERGSKSWIKINHGSQHMDRTSNITLQYLLTENDDKFWNNMDKATYRTLEVIVGENNTDSIEYWHQPRSSPTQPGTWLKARPKPEYIRVPVIFHEASTAYASENPGKDGGSVNEDYNPVWYEHEQAITVNNVHVTGAALFPTIGSWNPTLTMCAYTQALARNLEPEIQIEVHEDGSELSFYLPRPSEFTSYRRRDLLELAGHRVTFEILPPSGHMGRNKEHDEAILVLWGAVNIGGSFKLRPFCVPAATKASVRLPKDTNSAIKAGPHGAVYLRYRSIAKQDDRNKWREVGEISFKPLLRLPNGREWLPSWNLYMHKTPTGCPSDDHQPALWNLSGIAFNWFKERTRIGHFQFWTCKKDVNCGIHNHEAEAFMEVHMGLSPGTGNGLSRRVKDSVEVDRCRANDVDGDDSNFDRMLHLDVYEEQGGFWRRNKDGSPKKRSNGSVDYPYHGWKGGSDRDGLDIWSSVEYNPDMIYS